MQKEKKEKREAGEGQSHAGETPWAGGEEPRSGGPRARGHPGAPPRAQSVGGAAAVALRATRQSHEPPPSFPGTPRPRMARPGCACTQGGCGRTIERGRGNPAAAGREHPFAGALRRRGADVTAARPAAEGDGGPAGTGAPGPAGGTGAASLPAPRPPGAAEARPLFLRPRCTGVPGIPACSFPSFPSLAGSAGVGAAQRAGHGGRGEACGAAGSAVRITFGAPSLSRVPAASPARRVPVGGSGEEEGAQRIGGGKGLQVGPCSPPGADLEPCYRLSGLGPRCLGALWFWKITCIPGAVGFHPVWWGQKPWDELAMLLRLRSAEAVQAARHSLFLLLLCFEIALPKKWNSM